MGSRESSQVHCLAVPFARISILEQTRLGFHVEVSGLIRGAEMTITRLILLVMAVFLVVFAFRVFGSRFLK